MAHSDELAVGTVLRGRYRVEARLGRGSYGAAYRAIDLERFDAPRAVKRLHPDVRHAARAQALFEREARVLASITHPLVPCLHHYFELDGDFFLVEDFVDGESWDRVLARRGAIPEDEARVLAADVLDVLATLHARMPAVIHRDIKPSNLIRRRADGRTVLIDFGAVREVVEHEDPGTVIGSLGYAPREQSTGRPTPASDLYALGATLTQLLTRKPPGAWHDRETGAVDVAGKLPVGAPFAALIEGLFCDEAERIPTADEARRRLAAADAAAAAAAAASSAGDEAGLALVPTSTPTIDFGRRDGAPASLPVAGRPASGVTGATRAALPAPSVWTRPAVLLSAFVCIAAGGYGAVVGLSHKGDAKAAVPSEAKPDATPDTKAAPSAMAGPGAFTDATAAGPWQRAEAVTASGLAITIRHPAGWRARRPAGTVGSMVSHGGARLRAPAGSLVLDLPDSGGVFVVGLDTFADPTLPIERFLQDWAHGVGAGGVAVGIARPIAPDVYQATLTGGPADAGAAGFIHAVVMRERMGSRVLWRAFLGDAAAHQQEVRLLFDSLHVADATP
ncbi:MAG TPA: serine/threonine-protein kinase [Gemmatirosa sp.]